MPLFNARVKKFFSYYKPYKRLFAADVFCAVIVSAVSLIFPLCIRYVTGAGSFRNGTDNFVLPLSLLLAGLIVLQTACALFYDHMGHVMGARMERDMRNELFAHYQTLPFSFFDREKTGSILSRLTNDLLALAELYHHGPEDVIIYALTFTGALIILLRLNAGLTLVIGIFLPFMFCYSVFYGKILNRVYKRNREQMAEINARIDDSVGGIRTVKAFGNEGIEIEKFRSANEELYQSRACIYKHEARYFTGMAEFFARFILAAVAVAGGVKLSGSSLSISDYISFILYASYLTAPIPQLARVMAQYQQGLSGFNRFMDVLELPGENYGPRDPANRKNRPHDPGGSICSAGTEPDNIGGELEFVRACFKYSQNNDYILKDISFKAEPGDFIALTGPSGIGKTTLCSLIPRFYELTSGAIFIDGKNIRDMDIRDLRLNIGVVQQDVYVFAGTIGENIAYGKPGAPREAIIQAAKKAGAHDFIMALPDNYETRIGSRGATLSGGQKQRLSIARVFLKNPPILVFDEATSALDDESEGIVQQGLLSLSRNRTTIVIAHRLSTIQKALRVLVLNEGGITERRKDSNMRNRI
ncbi:MAG: ABC transporter ATP-binding protein/permease [Treponema sp.]|jgi:ATP-binding cassette subfamily B protein|nr:ABC transporter ATP-binding protein/permease [Treponema sp.]